MPEIKQHEKFSTLDHFPMSEPLRISRSRKTNPVYLSLSGKGAWVIVGNSFEIWLFPDGTAWGLPTQK